MLTKSKSELDNFHSKLDFSAMRHNINYVELEIRDMTQYILLITS